jgi:hypothetical protein
MAVTFENQRQRLFQLYNELVAFAARAELEDSDLATQARELATAVYVKLSKVKT